MARKAVSQELSKERILEGARGLFHQYGYRTLTMRSIAQAMGYSHGALYYHFREKAELLYALVVEDFDGLLRKQREFVQQFRQTGNPCLQKMMVEFIRFGLELPKHYEMMFMIDEPELQRYCRSEQTLFMDLFSSAVSEAASDQRRSGSREFSLPWSLFMSLHGFIAYNIHNGRSYAEVEELAKEHVKFLCTNFSLHCEPQLGS